MVIFYCLSHLNLHVTGFQNPIEALDLFTEGSENTFSGNPRGLQLPTSVPRDRHAHCAIHSCWAMKPGISLWHLWASHYRIIQALRNLKCIYFHSSPVSWWSNVFPVGLTVVCCMGSLDWTKEVRLKSSKYQVNQLTSEPAFTLQRSTKGAEKGVMT